MPAKQASIIGPFFDEKIGAGRVNRFVGGDMLPNHGCEHLEPRRFLFEEISFGVVTVHRGVLRRLPDGAKFICVRFQLLSKLFERREILFDTLFVY